MSITMFDFQSPKNYTLITGSLLFLFGLLGFAFKSVVLIPGVYLVFALIFGLWGVVISFKK